MIKLDHMIQGAISDCVKKALTAKQVQLHFLGDEKSYDCFQIGNDVFPADAAVEHILGEYSWWTKLNSKKSAKRKNRPDGC